MGPCNLLCQLSSVALPDAIASAFVRLPLDHGLAVGRETLPGQLVLDHPNVSHRHAAFEVAAGMRCVTRPRRK